MLCSIKNQWQEVRPTVLFGKLSFLRATRTWELGCKVVESLGFLAHRQDDMVAVAVRDVEPGAAQFTSLDSGVRRSIEVTERIPLGHKVALIDIVEGTQVIEYGQRVGVALANIAAGEMVHVHNIRSAKWQLA